MSSSSLFFRYGTQSVHICMRPSTSPEGTHSTPVATTGSLLFRGLCSRPWGALLPHFWRESALRVLPHAMTYFRGPIGNVLEYPSRRASHDPAPA